MAMRKLPVTGFVLTCLKCGSHLTRVEVRQDGVDFQCGKCGNKLILRPGESFKLQLPIPNIGAKKEEFEKSLDGMDEEIKREIKKLFEAKVPTDDWPTRIMDEYIKRWDNEK